MSLFPEAVGLRLGAATLPGLRSLRFSTHRPRPALIAATMVAALALTVIVIAPLQVTGTIVDLEGRPVRGATAELLVNGEPRATAVTDSRGRFSLDNVRRIDAYRMVATAPGYAPVELGTAPATYVMHRLPRIQGRLVDDVGDPVAGTLTLVRPGQSTVWTVPTDSDGFFSTDRGLEPGHYLVTVSAPKHDGMTEAVHLEEDHVVQLSASVKRQLGTLVLATDPPGLQPMLDGKPISGCTTPCTTGIPIGHHVLTIDSDLYVPWRAETSVKKGDRTSLNATLERKKGTLSITAPSPPDADLEVDGARQPSSPWQGLVPTGDRAVSYRSAAYWPATANAHVDWNQTTAITLNPSPVVPGDHDGFVAGLKAYLAAQGGQYSVFIQDINTGAEVGINEDTLLEAASVIKIPVALYVYQQSEAGKLNLDDQVELKSNDFMGGTGTLYGRAKAGDKYSYKDLVALLIQQSDNTAWQALNHALDAKNVDAYAGTIGAPDCDQWVDSCNGREIGAVLNSLARGKLLNGDDTQTILHLLETTVFNDRINYYLRGTLVAHKVGMDGGVINDAGVVFFNGDPVVISVFTTTDNADKGVQVIRDISRAAAHYFNH